jgi:hypothetical protein
MNGTTIIGGGLLPNPGATWQAKADGPIPAGGMDIPVPTAPPAPHLSTPDPTGAGLNDNVMPGFAVKS